jgi:alpha-mannosidase
MSDSGIIEVVGEGLQVTAFRKSFDRSGYIFRFYNGTDKMVNAVINVDKLLEHKIYRTNLSERERKSLDVVDGKIAICTQAKEIVTLFIEK